MKQIFMAMKYIWVNSENVWEMGIHMGIQIIKKSHDNF